MRKNFICFLIIGFSFLSIPVYSQTGDQAANDTALLGLPGDNLDLYATLDLFQKSKTIEEFEKTLNEEKTGINNLDLDLNKKVDFIKVVTKQDGDDFTFVLQVDVTEKEIQDVAVILVSKDKDKKITMQIVGDKELYGENYVIEPKAPAPAATPNPGYTGDAPAAAPAAVAPATTAANTAAAPAAAAAPSTTTVVVVEQAPIVQYVYSPVYVPYYPPYYYGFYPPYFAAFTVVAVGVYRHNNYYHHGGYYGGHGNTVVVHNTNNYNNYNNSRNTSNTVNHNKSSGNYNSRGSSATAKPSTTPSNNASRGSSATAKPSTTPSNNASRGSSATAKPSTTPSNNASKGTSASPSTSNRSSSASKPSTGSSRRMGGGGRRR